MNIKPQQNLCENGTYKQEGCSVYLICNITNENCMHIRWCHTEQCIKMSELYKICKVRCSDKMAKNKNNNTDFINEIEIEIDNTIDSNISTDLLELEQTNLIIDTQDSPISLQTDFLKEELCKVLYVKDKSFAIDFQGYGLSIHTDHLLEKEKIKDFIKVSYIGEIGSPDFKYFPIYDE
jgi:hypothetical protein